MSKRDTKEKKFGTKNITDFTGAFTILITVVAFLLRGYWYIYELGYCKAIGVSRIYIETESIATLYFIIYNLGLAGVLVASNYFVYFLTEKKKTKELIGVILFEVVAFSIIVFVDSNINFFDAITEMIKYNQQIGYLLLLAKMILIVVLVNLNGFILGLFRRIEQKDKTSEHNKVAGPEKIEIKIALPFFAVLLAIYGLVIFFIGENDGHNQKGYKVIVENVAEEAIDEKYIFSDGDNNRMRIYPVLYENYEIYIISYLCHNEDEIYIESVHQKIISKVEIETVYVEDIYTVGQKNNMEDNKSEVKESGGSNKRIGGLFEVLSVLVIGVLMIYLIEVNKYKTEKRNNEKFAAFVLYYDLKKIEDYLITDNRMINLQCSDEWKIMLANCLFLDNEDVLYICEIFDKIYKYNETFFGKKDRNKNLKKEKLSLYKELKEMIFGDCYDDGNITYNIKYERVRDKLEQAKM